MNGVLKACTHGTFEPEDCFTIDINEIANDKQLRVKREISKSGNSNAKENDFGKKIHALGRYVCLGCLYYGSHDHISPTENFWNKETISKHSDEVKKTHERGDVVLNENTLKRLNNLDIDASLKLSFMGGLVQVSGSANYLKEKLDSKKTVSISYNYWTTYGTRSLNQRLKKGKDHPDLCEMESIGKPGGQTHVVSSITRGERAVFTFSYETSDVQNKGEVGGNLEAVVKLLPSFQIEGDAQISITENENITASDLKCSFTSDIELPKLPTNFKEGVEGYQQLKSQRNVNTENILTFELEPIEKYCSDADSILNEISSTTIDEITTILQDLEDVNLEALTLSKSNAALTYKNSLGKVINFFLTALDLHAGTLKEKLKKNLPLMRQGNQEAETQIFKLLREHKQSPFHKAKAMNFLNTRRTALDNVELIIKAEKELGITIADTTAAVHGCNFNNAYGVKFGLNILPEENIVKKYIDTVNDSKPWKEEAHWYDNFVGLKKASAVFRDFLDYRKLNADHKDSCFFVQLSQSEEIDDYAKIVTTDIEGTVLKENFRLKEIGQPKNINVAFNYIKFEVSMLGDSFTNQIDVMIKEYRPKEVNGTLDKIATLKHKTVPIDVSGKTEIFIDQLIENTLYEVEYEAVSEVGRSSESKKFSVTTNAFSEPQNLRIPERNHSSISVCWEKPAFIAPNTTIVAYDVSITSDFGVSGKTKVKDQRLKVKTDETEFEMTVEGLEHSRKYIVEVIPISNHTYRLESDIKRVETKAVAQTTTIPQAPQAPKVISKSHFTIELRWDPPERLVEGSTVTSYSVRYKRIDPKSGEPLTTGNEKNTYTNKNEIILKNMAAGGTYSIEVKVDTTYGSSVYSDPTIESTPMLKTELDQFKDSLNLPDIEKRLEGVASLERKLTKIENSQNTCDVKTRTLHTLVNEIDTRTSALENKPRFAAEIRPSSLDYLPKGDITDFTELIDIGNIFDPQTGRLTIKDEGMYSLIVSGFKNRNHGNIGLIYVYKNHDLVQRIYEGDKENFLMMNVVFTLHLQKGDEVKLYNYYDESIYVNSDYPFTFTGYKI